MSIVRKINIGVGLSAIAGVLYLSFWPIPAKPLAWSAPTAPGYVGAHALNNTLAANGRVETFETAVRYQMYHALALIAALYGPRHAMMAQLAIEYDPHPPFNAGSVTTAPADIVSELRGAPSDHHM